MPRLLSSVIVDRLVYDAEAQPLCPITETVEAGTSYDVLKDLDYLSGVSAVPCSIVVANGNAYIGVTRAIQNATSMSRQKFWSERGSLWHNESAETPLN
jgi:hypothetical protein